MAAARARWPLLALPLAALFLAIGSSRGLASPDAAPVPKAISVSPLPPPPQTSLSHRRLIGRGPIGADAFVAGSALRRRT
jgi:hypothetical protein